MEVVIATEDDQPPTEWDIQDAARDEIGDNGGDVWPAEEVTSESELPPEWVESYPHGVEANATCAEILAEIAEAKNAAALLQDSPGQLQLPMESP